MTTPIDDRFVVTADSHTMSVVISIGDVRITVEMPAVAGIEEMSEEQFRQTAMRQLRRVLEVAREEIG